MGYACKHVVAVVLEYLADQTQTAQKPGSAIAAGRASSSAGWERALSKFMSLPARKPEPANVVLLLQVAQSSTQNFGIISTEQLQLRPAIARAGAEKPSLTDITWHKITQQYALTDLNLAPAAKLWLRQLRDVLDGGIITSTATIGGSTSTIPMPATFGICCSSTKTPELVYIPVKTGRFPYQLSQQFRSTS
jgi:hypothetical protein